MKNNKYIAIFDSGIGGFTTLMDASKKFPHESFLFYADTANVPYGEKSTEVIKELTMQAVDNISSLDVKAVVLACNTATSAFAMPLREKYSIPILGMEPAIRPALYATKNNNEAKRVLLLSTLLTMKGEKLAKLLNCIDSGNRVDCLALSELVGFAEELDFTSQRVINYLSEKILNLDLSQYGAIVLGCTHFIWYKELLQKLLPAHMQVFDGNLGTLEYLHTILHKANALSPRGQREILLHITSRVSSSKLSFLQAKLTSPARQAVFNQDGY